MDIKKSLMTLLSVTIHQLIFSSGLAIPVYSNDASSTANANGAEAASPSTLAVNPAGLIYLNGTQLDINLFIMQTSFKYSQGEGFFFKNHHQVKGVVSGNAGHRVEIPGIYLSHKINDRLAAGVGLLIPFGVDMDFPLDSVLRYNANRAKIITAILNPSIAFKITPNHSIGLSVFAFYSKSILRQFADITYGVNTYIDRFVPFINGREFFPSGTFESYATVKGSGWKYGAILGWLWDVNDDFRIGLSYRSKITVYYKGDAAWDRYSSAFDVPVIGPVVTYVFRTLGYKEKEKVKFAFHYPELWQLHGLWRVNEKLNLLGNIAYSKDSRQKSMYINWQYSKMTPDGESYRLNLRSAQFTEILLGLKNTWRASLGLTYQYSEPLQLRLGMMYANSSTTGPKGRLPISPDADRILLGLGFNYKYNKNLTIGAVYNFLKLKDAKVEATSYCGKKIEVGPGAVSCIDSRGSANANFKSKTNSFGLSLKYKL